MSKFFEALERSQREPAPRTRASASPAPADQSATLRPAPPSAGVEPGAPARVEAPVVEAPAAATRLAVDRPRRAAEHLVSLFDPTSYEARSEERRVGKECRSRGWTDHKRNTAD